MKVLDGGVSAVFVPRLRAIGVAVWLSAASGWAATLTNPSFEADVFTVAPGSIASNAVITGWTASDAGRVGLNPAGIERPYANNGIVPDGANVAYVVSADPGAVGLSTLLSELVTGETYRVTFRVNAPTNNLPTIQAGVDGSTLLTARVSPVGGTVAYRYAAFDFVASAATQTLWVTNVTVSGAHAVLLDNFEVAPSSLMWSYTHWTNDASSGVDGGRTYTHAYNVGSTLPADINGIRFNPVSGGNPAVAGRFVTAGLPSAHGDAANELITAGGGSSTLASTFLYNGSPETLTLFGLVPGTPYELTLYSVGWEAGLRVVTFGLGEDRLTVNQDAYGMDGGIRVTCRYVAPAGGNVTVAIAPMDRSGTPTTFHFYGFANCALEESPLIGRGPVDQVGAPGNTNYFRVLASGGEPLAYQWRQDGVVLGGATNAELAVAVAGPGETGAYDVVVTNALGAVTSAVANLTIGMIANPSFEADTFYGFPGCISASGVNPANGYVSGWSISELLRGGLNPLADGRHPFAESGIIPDGGQVAFLQSAGAPTALSTMLAGLTTGTTYRVDFYVNKRASMPDPTFAVTVDGRTNGYARVNSVGAGAYRRVAVEFTATNTTQRLSLVNETAGDTSLLVDDFSITATTSRWSYAEWTDDASSGVDASLAYTHAYSFGNQVSPTINGVRFTGVAGGNPAVAGRFTTVGLVNQYAGDLSLVTTNGGGSAYLARNFVYGGAVESVTIQGLTPGAEYEATIYGVGFDAPRYGRTATFSQGEARVSINEDHFGNDHGIRVSCRYRADAAGTATLSYEPVALASTFHTHGFANVERSTTNAPVIYRQPPAELWAGAGETVGFYTSVGGARPLFYQWRRNGVDVPGQTSNVLAFAAVTPADAGGYELVVSNALGIVVSSNATLRVGLGVMNPSFEVDQFAVYPGYISGNAVISGWSNTSANAGINPLTDQRAPFANTGNPVPDGYQVAFIQFDGTMSQRVAGATPGATYAVRYYVNSRVGYGVPTLAVTMDGETVVAAHAIDAGAYRVEQGRPIMATTNAIDLAFVKVGGDAVTIDDVSLVELIAMAPELNVQPTPVFQLALAGEGVAYDAGVWGTLPMTFQWQRDGVALAGQTNATLSIGAVTVGDSGTYRLVAANAFGAATSDVVTLDVRLPIEGLFNTGMDDHGARLADGAVDPHYTLVVSADSAYPGPQCYVTTNGIPGTYYPQGPDSLWIAPRPQLAQGNTGGLYTYRTEFSLADLDPATARLDVKWASDNDGLAVRINGADAGVSNIVDNAFAVLHDFSITNGFVWGANALEFDVQNRLLGPTALRVELTGHAKPGASGLLLILR